MLVLHLSVIDGEFLLWGETAPDSAAVTKRPVRPAQAATGASSPYDTGAAALIRALQEGVPALIDGGLKAGAASKAVAWLPTVAGRPVASSPLIAPPAAPGASCALTPWSVTTLPLTAGEAIALLSACVHKDTLAIGVAIGSTLLYWVAAMRFAGALVAREQFLPDIQAISGGYRARWLPVFTGTHADTFAMLSRSMPSACRALARDAQTLPDGSASALLRGVLEALCDHLVRSVSTEPSECVPAPKRRSQRTSAFHSLHDQWLHALRAPDGTLRGDAVELKAFAEQVNAWRRPLTLSLAAPFRLCFRLEEPLLQDGDSWFARFLLQSTDDSSLFIPAEQVWAKRAGESILLRRDGFEPREFLLTALGQAAKVFPQIEAALRSAAPAGCDLDTAGAERFLQETAWMLEQSGFVVQLPAWWTRRGSKLRLAARASVKAPKMRSAAGLSMETLMTFQWQATLGGEPITREEMEALAKQKVGLVRLRGQWVQLDAGEIEAALEFWKRRGRGTITAREAIRMALGAESVPGGMEIEGVEADGWLGDLLSRLQSPAKLDPLPAPAGVHASLRPYQQRGYEWLSFLGQWGLGACLADDMGLGKTLQTLAFIRQQWDQGDRRPILVICPTSVVGNWYREAQRFTPDLPVVAHHGLTRARGEAFQKQAAAHGLTLSSYALLHRDLDLFKQVEWRGVVLDEAQNIKNPETRQSKAARALPAAWRIALSGTPVENHVGDLWAIMDFLNPGLLGGQTEFRRTFFTPIQSGADPDAAERLKRVTQPFILRRLKTDRSIIADLPDKLEMKVYCTLTPEQASLYEAVVKEATEAIDEAEGIQRRGVILATLSKLKQVCNHPAQFLGDNSAIPDRSGKLIRLTEMLEEVVAAGDRALIFSQFAEMGEIVRRHLQEVFGREALFLHGGVPQKERDRMTQRFQQGGTELPFFILSLKAGGVGLNLTAANHVFHYDRWWNPAVENQATDRAFRIGQMKNVQVHKFLCAGTLEERIDEMIENKRHVAASVVGSGEEWLTGLSTAELKDLLALRRDALIGAA